MASRWIFFFLSLCSLPGHAYQSWSAGLAFEQFDYSEEISSPLRSHEIGWIPLLIGNYQNRIDSNWMFELDGRGTYKTTTRYEGSDLATYGDVVATDVHSIFDGEATLSFFPDKTMIRFFGGVGAHSWDRFLAYGTGYREIYMWSNFTLGAGYLAVQNGPFRLWIEGAIRPIWSARMKVIFSETVQGGEDTTLTLGPKVGFLIRVPTEWEFSPGYTMNISGFYEEIRLGGTGTVSNSTPGLGGTIREPDSRLRQLGFSASLGTWF